MEVAGTAVNPRVSGALDRGLLVTAAPAEPSLTAGAPPTSVVPRLKPFTGGDVADQLSRALRTLRDAGESCGAVRAPCGAHLDALHGDRHALVRGGGSGRSTLVEVLAGVHRPDSGGVLLLGRPGTSSAPRTPGPPAPP
ncbi:MAG: hypothetical protein AVDCRST_MAG35-2943 [uncultured Quadrisphaera sp.]|uniref:ABC transporter domain-containing protein n=1 Tax=uncultured Quadrisphaera sp. TaxID=904978 RepID=A0A6J4Q7K9_9ACTN|nr:MAG: hypothetical protein AVDCRST_MAG35-2943 [uncultured Quadrisphaera sp.]